MFNVKDHAEGKLKVGISSTVLTLALNDGDGAKFPEAPFLVVLNQRDENGEITKHEKIEIEAKNGDILTIKTRGFEGDIPQDFNVGDFVSLFVLARHIEDLRTENEKKVNKTEVFQNLKGTPNSLIRFDSNGNGEAIPEGQQGESLVIGADGKAGFGIAETQVSYLSTKRELGEDFDLFPVIPVIPKFNGNNTQDGYIVSADSSYNSTYQPWKAFNGTNTNNEDCRHKGNGVSYPNRLQIQCPKAVQVKQIEITPRLTLPQQAPRYFIFQGSNDGTNWNDLETFIGKTYIENTTETFNINSDTAYIYHRIYIITGDDNGCSIGKFQMIAEDKTKKRPKAYFIGDLIRQEKVIKTQNLDVGKTSKDSEIKFKNSNNDNLDSLEVFVEKIGNPENLFLKCFYGKNIHKVDTYDYPEYDMKGRIYKKKNVVGKVKIKYRPYNNYGKIKINDSDTNQLLGEISANGNETKTKEIDIGEEPHNIDIFCEGFSGNDTLYLFLLEYFTIYEVFYKKVQLNEGINIINHNGLDGKLKLSSNSEDLLNYWRVGTDGNGILAGTYNFGYGLGKKYISYIGKKGREKVNGIEIIGGKKGEKTTGIEGGVFELPEDVNLNGKIYVNDKSDLTNNITKLYLGNVIGGKYIKIGGNKKILSPKGLNSDVIYTAESDGFVQAWASSDRAKIYGEVNGSIVTGNTSNDDGFTSNGGMGGIFFIVKEGDTYKVSGNYGIKSAKFYPLSY